MQDPPDSMKWQSDSYVKMRKNSFQTLKNLFVSVLQLFNQKWRCKVLLVVLFKTLDNDVQCGPAEQVDSDLYYTYMYITFPLCFSI